MSPTLLAQHGVPPELLEREGDTEVLTEGLKTHTLLQEKLRALEQLVFVLRKRVLVFESNQELVDMMDKYGSVKDLVQQMEQLEDENSKLRLRELEFARDPLIRRRVCSSGQPTVTAALLLALQNELQAASAVIEVSRSFPCRSLSHPLLHALFVSMIQIAPMLEAGESERADSCRGIQALADLTQEATHPHRRITWRQENGNARRHRLSKMALPLGSTGEASIAIRTRVKS